MNRIFVLRLLTFFFAGLISWANSLGQSKSLEVYRSIIANFYSKIYSNKPLSLEETAALLGEYSYEMEEYLVEECRKKDTVVNCDPLVRELIDSGFRGSVFFEKVRAMKREFTSDLDHSELAIALRGGLTQTDDDKCSDCVFLRLQLTSKVFIHFQLNVYPGEEVTINDVYMSEGGSLYNDIYPEAGGYLKFKGTINDIDGHTNLRKGPGSDFEIVGRIKAGEVFKYTPSSKTNWWKVYDLDSLDFLGYIYYDRIVPAK